jgi:hypothetical protein
LLGGGGGGGGGEGWSGRVLIITANQQIVHVRDKVLIIRLKIILQTLLTLLWIRLFYPGSRSEYSFYPGSFWLQEQVFIVKKNHSSQIRIQDPGGSKIPVTPDP